ncbi:hypothetical protein [Actinoplanes awajinensis]|uniref:hypothetical protein n=1 Tax=Actinoplanes awajinensis TaxID=135946 RepID=UPI000B0029D7|nr:hypothetical protein [Actinoplanes awajinensis]
MIFFGQWTRVAAVVLGALLLGVVGATAGSWVAGREFGALPDDVEAVRLAQEILPGAAVAEEIDRHDFLYGAHLGDEEYGPGYVQISYQKGVDCDLDRLAWQNAAKHGWEEAGAITGRQCSSWNFRRGDLVMAYAHQGSGTEVTFYRSTTRSTIGALIGALGGILAGVAVFRPLSRRPVVLLAALIPPALILVPVTGLVVVAAVSGVEGPTPQLWSVWPALARLVFS